MYGAGQSLAVPDPASMYLLIGDDGPGVAMYLRNSEQGASGHMTVGFDGAITSIRRADR